MTSMTYGRRSAIRYLDDGLETATPAALLIMLYDRLVLDLQRAEQALLGADRETAHKNLLHAQDIVLELVNSLKVDQWEGGESLRALYAWLLTELSAANVAGDAERTAACRTAVVEPLVEAWRQAVTDQARSAPVTGHGIA